MVIDLESEGPSQGTQAPDQQPEVIKIPIETPAQSGADIIVIKNHKLPGESPNNSKSKKVNPGPLKKHALGQAPAKDTKKAPGYVQFDTQERPSTSQFNGKKDLDVVHKSMMSAQYWLSVLTGATQDSSFCFQYPCYHK